MARTTPRVAGATLVAPADDAWAIAVGTPAWYAWLEGASTFAFVGTAGSFTARKEPRPRTEGYWKAYRKRAGVVRSVYLGKGAELTLERLQSAAATLAELAAPEDRLAQAGAERAPSDTEAAVRMPPALPLGAVTFLFTDIAGSTTLWEHHPQLMSAALARHDALVGREIAAHSGVVFKSVGDSAHAVFARASDALSAALACQQALQAEAWGQTGPLQVRMALHSGTAELRDGDYFGPPLNRVARILALGHGGQVLLSHTTHDLVANELPSPASLRDLGEHPLKDLSRPEQIFQLLHPDLPSEFLPLWTLEPRPVPAATPPLQLLATKLYAPPPRPQLVARERLVKRLCSGLIGKLTLIAAPAGFGKTTLVSEWRASPTGSAMPVAWVSLDVDDNDPTRFWSYVIAALETVYPQVGASTMALLRSSQPLSAEVILTPLLNAISTMPADAALILDDYHLITTPAIHAAVSFLLDHLPPQLHLIMLTRADPPLPLTRLRSRRELTELRAADLRFTAEETAAFLTEMLGLPLTSEQVTALEARTEGWVAGLQLAALAMQNRADRAGFVAAFSGSNRFVVDYLVEEVLNRLPAHLQTFVLQTSILDQLCGSLCDALLGVETFDRSSVQTPKPGSMQTAYSQLILDQLERANLFLIPLDDERRWYRYHHLFAEVLRARLYSGATAGEVAALHLRASAWYEQAGMIGEAVRYAVLVHDSERAAALIERYALTILLASSNLLLVRAWVEQVPRALIVARPRLTLIAGITLALTGQFDAVEQLLLDASPAFSAPDISPNTLGERAALRSTVMRFQRDAASALALAQQALAQLATDNHIFRAVATLNMGIAAMWRGEIAAAKATLSDAATLGEQAGSQWIALGALEELASLQARVGELRQVLRTSERAEQMSARLGGLLIPAAGVSQVGSAEVFYEWNDLARAMQAATRGIDLLRGTVERLLLVRGYIVVAQIHQAQGDHNAALEAIQRCEDWFGQTPIVATGAALDWLAAYQARLWVWQGNLVAAARWAQECAFADDSELNYVQQLTLVWLRLRQSHDDSGGRFLEASTMLAELLPAVEARGWTRYRIEILALQSLVCHAQGDRASALAVLEHALILAETEGYVRVFADAGAPMAALLAQSAERRAQRDAIGVYIERLLSAFPVEQRATSMSTTGRSAVLRSALERSNALVEPLSERELEVLRLIADGYSNQAIADRLVIAVSTAKRHINNLYGKLGVQSRTQALVRARELHLL